MLDPLKTDKITWSRNNIISVLYPEKTVKHDPSSGENKNYFRLIKDCVSIALTRNSCCKFLHLMIQSNLAIPTPGFPVTPLITSVFQSPDFLHIILI